MQVVSWASPGGGAYTLVLSRLSARRVERLFTVLIPQPGGQVPQRPCDGVSIVVIANVRLQ